MIKLQNDKSRSHGCKKHFFLSLSVWVCVCNFQLSESGSAWAIRAWMISQASLPYPPLKCESHSYCVPPPLIMFSNDSAKRQGIPAACHRPAQKCADGVITGAINAHHPQLFCPTCAFFCLSGKGEGGCRMSTLFNQPTESRNAKALICAAVSSHPLKVGFFKCFNHLRRTVSNTIIAEYDTSSAMQMAKVSIQTQHEFYSKQMAI